MRLRFQGLIVALVLFSIETTDLFLLSCRLHSRTRLCVRISLILLHHRLHGPSRHFHRCLLRMHQHRNFVTVRDHAHRCADVAARFARFQLNGDFLWRRLVMFDSFLDDVITQGGGVKNEERDCCY